MMNVAKQVELEQDHVNEVTAMTSSQYHKLPGTSNSQLSDYVAKFENGSWRYDPRKFWFRHVSGMYRPESKPHFDFGSAAHDIILLNDESNIAVIPEGTLAKNGAKLGNKWLEFERENAGKLILKQSEYKRLRATVNAVLYHPLASQLLAYPGESEKYFSCEWSGIQVRCKVDRIAKANGKTIVFDLKTYDSDKDFAYSVEEFEYFRQEYVYRKVLDFNNINVDAFFFIAVSTQEPHNVDVFTLDREYMQLAADYVDNMIADVSQRMKSNNWQPDDYGKVRVLHPSVRLKRKLTGAF